MIKKIFPIILITFVWLIFSKPFFLENKIPYPADFQVNQYNFWNTYSYFWQPVKNPAMPDTISEIMPWKKLTTDEYKNGHLPLWNPYSFSGTPHMANYQSAIFSITTPLFFVFDFKNAWGLSILIQPLLAGIFMYLFTKSLKLSNYASTISSIAFMFSGFIITWMSWGTLSLALAFLPLALFAIEKFTIKKQTRYLLLLSLIIPLSFFSGHFQISLYFAGFTLVYIFFKLYENKNFKEFINLISFYFLGILLSMIQIVPSIEFYRSAYRSAIFQKIDAIPFSRLTTIIAPDFYGNPVTRNAFLNNYGEWNFFAGVIPFILAIYSLISKNKKVFFFAISSLIALLLCIDSPVADLVVKLKIPVISTSSLSRILGIFALCISILAGFGLDYLFENIKDKKYKNIIILFSIFAFIFIFLWGIVIGKLIDERFFSIALKNIILPSVIFTGFVFAVIISLINKKLLIFGLLMIITLTTFDMFRFASKWQPFSSKEIVFANTPIINKLQSLDNTYRFIGPFEAEGAVYYRLPSTEGYDPLYINRYGELNGSLQNGKIHPSDRVGVRLQTNGKFAPKIIDLIGIKYVLLKKTDRYTTWAFPFKNFPKGKFHLIYKEKDYFIFENKDVYPRAFLVGKYAVENNDQRIIDKILDKNFDLRKNVVLENNPKISQTNNLKGSTEIIKYSPNNVLIKTNSDSDSVLVLADNYYPGWHVKVNGKETEVIRADYTFRGVAVPKGENTVEFYYLPESLKIGALLSLLGLITITFILVVKWYTNSKWNHPKTAKSATK